MPDDPVPPSRRTLLRHGLLALGAMALAPVARAFPSPAVRRLRLYHTHTGERLDVVYRDGETYVPGALSAIDRHLRDFRTGDVHPIEPRLLDVVTDVLAAAERQSAEVHVISGYRSSETNEALRHHTTGVVRNSLHLAGRALDLRVPGFPTRALRDAGLSLGEGGVGYYADSDFVHLDTGRVRRW